MKTVPSTKNFGKGITKTISSTPFLQHHASVFSLKKTENSDESSRASTTSPWISINSSVSSETSTVQSNQQESTNFISTPIIILICGSVLFLFVALAFFLVLLIRKRKKENKYFEIELGLRNEKGEKLYDENGKRITV